MDLTALRNELDTLDKEILALFLRRMEICGDIARYKIQNDLPIFHPGREAEILGRVAEEAGSDMALYAMSFFQGLLDTSKALQKNIIENSGKTIDK